MTQFPDTLPKFLWHFAKRYKWYLLGFVFVAAFWAANISLSPYAMKLIIDRVSAWDNKESLYSLVMFPASLYVGLYFLVGIVFLFYDWLMIRTYPGMKVQIVEEMFDYVEKHSYSYFQHNFSGSLGNKINDMARCATSVINSLIDNFVARFLTVLVGSFTMYLVHPYFAYVMLGWSAIFIAASVILSRRAQKYSEVFSEARSTVVGKIVDSIGNILNVKLFAREKFEKRYLRKYLEDGAAKDRRGLWYLLKVKAFYNGSIVILTIAIMWLLIHERYKNTITVGDFALILTLTMFLIEEVYYIADQLVPLSEEIGTCKQALSIISPAHEILDQTVGYSPKDHKRGDRFRQS